MNGRPPKKCVRDTPKLPRVSEPQAHPIVGTPIFPPCAPHSLWAPQFSPQEHPTPCRQLNSSPTPGGTPISPPLYGGHPTSSFSIAIHFPVSPIFLLLLTVPQNSPGGDSNPLGRGVIPNKVV